MPKSTGESADGGLELPLAELPGTHPCSDCGHCCDYVAVEIDSPTVFKDYEHIHWYLTHRAVSVYIDWEGAWFVEFKTVCEHKSPMATCGIYEERPQICSEFSWDECEETVKQPAYRHHFESADAFFAWMEESRPSVYTRYQKSREKLLKRRQKRPVAAPRDEPIDERPAQQTA